MLETLRWTCNGWLYQTRQMIHTAIVTCFGCGIACPNTSHYNFMTTLSVSVQRNNTSHLQQQSDGFSSYLTSSPDRIYAKPLDNRLSLCLPNSMSTNTANTHPGAPPLLLSLTQWGVGQACVDSGVAPVSPMIHTQCCANLRVSTHTNGAHALPAGGLLCNNRTLSLALHTHE